MYDDRHKQLLGLLSDMRDAAREWEVSALNLSLASEEATSPLIEQVYRHQASALGHAKNVMCGFAWRLDLIILDLIVGR